MLRARGEANGCASELKNRQCVARGTLLSRIALFHGRATRERKVETEELPEFQRDMSDSPSQVIIKVILPFLSRSRAVFVSRG